MGTQERDLKAALDRVRRRWGVLVLLRVTARVALAVSGVCLAAFGLWLAVGRTGLPVLFAGGVALFGALTAVAWGGWPARRRPSDRQVARFVEERCSELEDRVASAAEFASAAAESHANPLMSRMCADAVTRLRALDLDRIVSRRSIRRAAARAGVTLVVCVAAALLVSRPLGQAVNIARLYLFPAHVTIDVAPGHARIITGQRLDIRARLNGASGIIPSVVTGDGPARRTREMTPAADGSYRLRVDGVTRPFTYAVTAGKATSRWYNVEVLRPGRVARVDLRYDYPTALKLAPRTERDGGDIYAPAGTRVRVTVHADKAIRSAALVMDDGSQVPLPAGHDRSRDGEIAVQEDGSYRIALVDADGLTNAGDSEYFIRTLDDRPPDVRIVEPGADRQVSPLEEVTIAARAEDDYGIAHLELVYSVRGAAEKRVALGAKPGATVVDGAKTLYLEELGVRPGDFVTYYATARDVTRGKKSTEARSDIFFLEVKPFEEEFAMAQSQASGGGAGNRSLHDLVRAQKDIIIATWKLDTRSRKARADGSSRDIASVARAQGELKTRAEQVAARMQPASRALRRRPAGSPVSAEEPGEQPMAKAIEAMGRAKGALDTLETTSALPHEMEALNELLKAQAEVRRHEIVRGQANGGSGSMDTGSQDLSALFDRELQRQQQTNYETPRAPQSREQVAGDETLDRLRDLARRQDESARRQQELARQRAGLSGEELKRQLERLTREQSELRQQAEELSRQLGRQPQTSPSGQPGQSGQSGRSATEQQMREVSREMGNAASGLRRQDLGEASARSARALERLRDLERQMRSAQPGEGRRVLGDLQLEARQLADEQRRIAGQTGEMARQPRAGETMRRLAGDKERLAERLDGIERGARDLARGRALGADERKRVGEVVAELGRQRLGQKMRESAAAMRKLGEPDGSGVVEAHADTERQLARSLQGIADRLSASGGLGDAQASRLGDQLRRAREARDRLSDLAGQMERLQRQQGAQNASGASTRGAQGRGGQDATAQGQRGATSAMGQGSGAGAGTTGTTGTAGAGDEAGRQRELARLRQEYLRQLREANGLMGELRHERGGAGITPEGQEMVMSAPGTEAFKQDFAGWESLRRNVDLALEQIEASLSARLQDRQARDRVQAAGEGRAPESYRRLVDEYYRSLARKRDR
jgi:hypothetical protein